MLLHVYKQSISPIYYNSASDINVQKPSKSRSCPPALFGLFFASKVTLKSPPISIGDPWKTVAISASSPHNSGLLLAFVGTLIKTTTTSKSLLCLFSLTATENCPILVYTLVNNVSFHATTSPPDLLFALTARKPSKNLLPTMFRSILTLVSCMNATMAPHSRRYCPTIPLLRSSRRPRTFHEMHLMSDRVSPIVVPYLLQPYCFR